MSDFTYLRFKQRFVYLATLLDLYTREILGFSVSLRHDKHLITNAFLDAYQTTSFIKPSIIHSDQGAEYCSKEYTSLMTNMGIQISMSKKSSPWENAYQESFYNNFKTDLGLEFDRFEDEGHLLEAIHHTINYYNNERIHTSLGMPPTQFRRRYESLRKIV